MKVATIGLDIAKQVFQVHGADKAGKVMFRRKLKRGEMARFFSELEPCLIGLEASGSVMTGYVYDADGNRVAKGPITRWSCDPTTNGFESSGNETNYVLNQSGQIVTETTLDGSGNAQWVYTNVYANGSLFATYNAQGLHFLLNDWLGTRRASVNASGTIESFCASLPYGDDLICSGALDTPNEQHFTGKTHDQESGNDYFGARYYAENMGLWMSPDWSEAAVPVPYANLSDPQTLNLYEYTRNNPLSGIDPDGHNWFTDFLNGVADATYRPLAFAVQHPVVTGKAIGNSVAHPIATYYAVKSGVVTTSQLVMTGNGTAIGTAVGTVGMSLIPGAGEAGDAAEGAADLAKIGEAAGDSGSLMGLNKFLASQEQMGQLAAGQGEPIAGAGTSTTLRDADRLAAQYGGQPGDWQKVTSGNYNLGGAKGGGFETHAYQNSKTGQVVEMKTKFQ